MVLYMNRNQLGKRRNIDGSGAIYYAVVPGSLRELIAETVKLCVSRYIRGDEPGRSSAYQCADRRYGAGLGRSLSASCMERRRRMLGSP